MIMSSINKIKLLDENLKDLVNGYCKQKYTNNNNLSHTFPHALIILISLFCNFIDKSDPYLFKIKFTEFGSYPSFTDDDQQLPIFYLSSIASYFIVSNKCYKLLITIGDQLQIIIGIKNNLIFINNNNTKNQAVHNGYDNLFKITCNFVEVMVKINGNNSGIIDKGCHLMDCGNNGCIELFFRNVDKIHGLYLNDKVYYNDRVYGEIKKKGSDGFYKIKLNSEYFDYESKQQVSVKSYTYGIDKLNLCSSDQANLPCPPFGFGSQN